MRRLGHLPNLDDARRLAVALKDRGVKADFRSVEDGVAIWVLDEDHLAAAREELAAFEANPNAERYRAAAVDVEPRPADTPKPVPARPPATVWRRVPVTLALVVASLAATFASNFGELGNPVHQLLSFSSYEVEGDFARWDGLADIEAGQIWRLFTPMFLHGDPLHLLGNVGMLWVLGGAVESVRGSLRLLAVALAIAAVSNLAEYWLDFGFTFDSKQGFRSQIGIRPSPFFLGMSGVVFGLFGLIWTRARLVPGSRFVMPRDLVVWMLIWLLVCTAGFAGPIANVAHGVGLLAGMVVGAAPRLRRRGPHASERNLSV